MAEMSYDQLISEFIDSRVESDNFIWKQAAIAFLLRKHMSVPAKTVAGDVGYSERYISNLVKCFDAFPTEEDRAMDKSFSHHLLAAGTDNPAHWIDLAVQNAWSVREMKREIDGETATQSPMDKAQKAWENILKIIEQEGEPAEFIKEQITLYAESNE